MILKSVALFGTAMAALAVPAQALSDGKNPVPEPDYCIALPEPITIINCGLTPKLSLQLNILNTTGIPPVDASTQMYLLFNDTLLDPCYDVTYFDDDGEVALFVGLPKTVTCVQLWEKFGSWCIGTCASQGKKLRGRSLQEKGVLLNDKNDAMYQAYSTKCANFEYDVSLYVDTHMMAVASPGTQDAIAAGCPLVVTHSKYDPVSDQHEKELLAWLEENSIDQANSLFNADSYYIGTFKGSDLTKAHESIDIDKVMGGKSYDIVSNNCAAFMIALAKSLNVKIDAKMTAFVARRLLQSSSNEFVDRIRSSINFKSLFSDGSRNLRSATVTASSPTDQEILELLVKKNSAGLV